MDPKKMRLLIYKQIPGEDDPNPKNHDINIR